MKKVNGFSHSVFVMVMTVGLASLVGCETNPYTGRSQLLMTSVAKKCRWARKPMIRSRVTPKCTVARSARG